jgi:hypothetical protein
VGALQRPKKALFAKLIAGIGYFAFAQKSFENAVIGIEFAARFSSDVYNACDGGSVRQESSGTRRPAEKGRLPRKPRELQFALSSKQELAVLHDDV